MMHPFDTALICHLADRHVPPGAHERTLFALGRGRYCAHFRALLAGIAARCRPAARKVMSPEI